MKEKIEDDLRQYVVNAEKGTTLIVAAWAYCYSLNSNTVTATFRKLVKEGLIKKEYMATAGNTVYAIC